MIANQSFEDVIIGSFNLRKNNIKINIPQTDHILKVETASKFIKPELNSGLKASKELSLFT